jgi:hypothetical protein
MLPSYLWIFVKVLYFDDYCILRYDAMYSSRNQHSGGICYLHLQGRKVSQVQGKKSYGYTEIGMRVRLWENKYENRVKSIEALKGCFQGEE